MNKLFEFVLPKGWRTRREPKPETNDLLLARLSENDPLYRALMDHAYAQFENDSLAALQPKLTASEREFLCGRASAMAAYISTIEHTSVRARAEVESRARQQQFGGPATGRLTTAPATRQSNS